MHRSHRSDSEITVIVRARKTLHTVNQHAPVVEAHVYTVVHIQVDIIPHTHLAINLLNPLCSIHRNRNPETISEGRRYPPQVTVVRQTGFKSTYAHRSSPTHYAYRYHIYAALPLTRTQHTLPSVKQKPLPSSHMRLPSQCRVYKRI